MKKIFTLLFFITSINLAQAQSFTATYPFSSVTSGSGGTTDPTPTPTVSGLTCGSFVAVGVNTQPSSSFSFAFGGFTNTGVSINTAIAQYYEVTLTSATGSLVSLNTLTFTAQRSSVATAPKSWAVRSSLDGYAANLGVATATSATIMSPNTFTSSTTNLAQCAITPSSSITFSNGGSVTFRFYIWQAPTTAVFSIDNVSFSGSVSPIPTAPIAPSSLTAVYQATLNNHLTWVDNSNNETGFELWCSVNSGTYSLLTNTIAANATSYTHTGLSYNTNYCYEIRAMNGGLSSAFSNTACVSTPSAPIAPSSLTAVYQATLTNHLTWQDNSSDETNFELWYSVNSGTYNLLTNTIAANATSYTHTGLSYNTNYCYEIRAVNAAGNSAFSNTACVTTPTFTPPTSRIYYYARTGGNDNYSNQANWRVGTSFPFSANNSATMTTPGSAPSVNDTIAFDDAAGVSFSTTVSYCQFDINSVSVSCIIIPSSYSGAVDMSSISFFHADTMSIDGNGGVQLYAPYNGTIEIGKNLFADNISSTSIQDDYTLQLSGSTTQSITGSGFSVAALKITGTGTKILNAPVTILDNVDVGAATLNTNGNLILAASNGLTARIAPITGGGSISGNVTAWTYAPGPNTGWALLGSNGVNGATVNNWNTGGSYNGGQQIPMTCANCVYGPSSAGGGTFYSIQGWNEAATTLTTAYTTTVVTSTALSPGKGFWVYVGTGLSTTSDITYSLSGTVVQGSTTTPITRSASSPTDVIGWNLVANPYASPISSSSVITANSGILNSAAVYLWNADINNYVTNPSDIPAGQGFYVESLSASASFSFNEGMKSTGNTSPLLKTAITGSGFTLRIDENVYGSHDETEIGINENATLGYDHLYDAHKLYSTPNYYGYTGIYTQYTSIATLLPDNSGNDICYLNTLPELTDSIVVPVLAKAMVSGSYTIGIKRPNPISTAKMLPTCVMLKDKVTGLYHDLKMSDYVFTMADTTSAPRFELLLCRDNQVDVSVKELNASNTIFITQDENGAVVKTHFEQPTKATISVFNIMGQQLIKDQTVTGTETITHLNLDTKNQVLIIRVTTDQQCVTKKMVLR